ncbi:MAG: hypothetical protein ABIR05_05495 [Luteimonas sp.]
MKSKTTQDPPGGQTPAARRQPYATPAITILGMIRNLTATGSQGGQEKTGRELGKML